MARNFIAFDLEGPLTPHDHAYELMSLYPGGDHTFEVLSRYDDLLVLENRQGYEPGNTLTLIVPFLLYHGIGVSEITRLANENGLVSGAGQLVADLGKAGWQICLITTTYRQYAQNLAKRLGIRLGLVTASDFPLDEAVPSLSPLDFVLYRVQETEEKLRHLSPVKDDAQIKQLLDEFYWKAIPATPLGRAVFAVKPVGGTRKVSALRWLSSPLPFSQIVAVGDSITDFCMLQEVDRAGGLAIAFNANRYALPYATAGLASTHISDLLPLLEVWQKEGREGAEAWVKEREAAGGKGDRGHFHWLSGGNWEKAEPTHSRLRRLVRSRAALLG